MFNIALTQSINTAAHQSEQDVIKDNWLQKGYVDEPISTNIDLPTEIRRICREKNAVILAHYYTRAEIQDVADFTGDSLALAQKAAATNADIIVMCGVQFMAETCKILCPEKTVLLPDLNARCSLADSCPAEEFEQFVKAHPGYTVLSYVNTSAAVKAVTDVVVTSGNARLVVDSFPKDERIIFAPDRNLGNYINAITGRNMLLWDGACHVHSRFSVPQLVALKANHAKAKVLAHPECNGAIIKIADYVGSTAALLKYARESSAEEFIVATESGILHEMRKLCPTKRFFPVPPDIVAQEYDAKAAGVHPECACNECSYMRLNTLEKLFNCLTYCWPAVDVSPSVAEKAVKPIQRMLGISRSAKPFV